MPDGSVQSALYDPATDQNHVRSRRRKPGAIGLKIVATVLLAAGLAGIAVFVVGLQQGWLRDAWNGLTDAQGAVLGSALTIYAAALAAILGPLIFTGQIMSMREASEQAITDIGSHVEQLTEKLEYVRKLVRHADELPGGQSLDADQILLALEGARQDAAALATDALEQSRRRAPTKARFAGMWPGRGPYTELLRELEIITDDEKASFDRIAGSRKHSRETASAEVLADVQATVARLRESLEQRRSKSKRAQFVEAAK